MKPFRTIVPIKKSTFFITHETPVFLMGSCFTEHIGAKLLQAKFPVLQNSFGILYNPFSIIKNLERIIDNQPYELGDIIQQGERWVSFDHHSCFAKISAEETLQHINNSLRDAHFFLKETKVVFVSLGTANVYRHKSTQKIVANCHKFPAIDFDTVVLKKDDIVSRFRSIIKKINLFNPTIKIIFTVSPIRHLKAGFTENQVSKAILLLAINDLREKEKSVFYFPSYEILLDDLRDYRFYASDMVHPSEEAIDYIFRRFLEAYLNKETQNIVKEVLKINSAFNHRPFNPNSQEYQIFITKTIEKINAFQIKHPYLNYKEELKKTEALRGL